MLCERCGQREATSHFKQTINGQTTVMNLCPKCAAEMGLEHFFQGFHFDVGDMFSGLLGNLSSAAKAATQTKTCPECHSDLRTIIDTGKIGCARCYTTFRNELMPTIEQLHGKVNHQGKLPRSAGEAARKKAQLSSLKKKLETAVQEQDFESAAKYRDEIRALETGETNNE